MSDLAKIHPWVTLTPGLLKVWSSQLDGVGEASGSSICWGTGNVLWGFLHAGDVQRLQLKLVEVDTVVATEVGFAPVFVSVNRWNGAWAVCRG